jgi:hypothetical protein
MRYFPLAVLALIGLLGAGPAATEPPTLPVAYTLNTPLYGADELVIRVHQTEQVTLGRVMAGDQPDFEEQAEAGGFRPGVANTYIAGDLTAQRMAKYQSLGRSTFEVRDAVGIEPGKRYPHPDHEGVEWQVDDLTVSMERGDSDTTVAGLEAAHYIVDVAYTYQRFDGDDGDETRRQVAARREFWFAEALPFSPVQLLPLELGNSTFAPLAPERIQRAIYGRLAERMRAAGMLVRTRFERRGDPVVVAVQDLRAAAELDLSALDSIPMIPSSVADAAMGPLFLSRMIGDRMPDGGSARIAFQGAEAETASRNVSGRSAFTVADSGDAVIVLSFDTDDGARGMLMLMRPYGGRPETGSYRTAGRLSKTALDGMTTEAVRERAQRFQALGLIEDAQQGRLTIYTSAQAGQVVLIGAGDDGLTGKFSLTLQALDAFGGGSLSEHRVTGSFDSVPGLEMRMRSPTSRRLQ